MDKRGRDAVWSGSTPPAQQLTSGMDITSAEVLP